jgi:hypothetical protein
MLSNKYIKNKTIKIWGATPKAPKSIEPALLLNEIDLERERERERERDSLSPICNCKHA